jgi:hypothetical protein
LKYQKLELRINPSRPGTQQLDLVGSQRDRLGFSVGEKTSISFAPGDRVKLVVSTLGKFQNSIWIEM